MRAPAATIAIHLALLLGSSLALAIPTPKGGCPAPEHTLVAAEFQVGSGSKPRWLEVVNPGKAAVSLDNVVVRIKAKGIAGGQGGGGDVLEFAIAEKIAALPAGEVLLIGHLPTTPGVKGPYYGLQLIDLGATFQLPLCNVSIELIGPAGPIDTLAYDLCKGAAKPDEALWQTVMALDPDHTDICKNDQLTAWCQPTAKTSLTKPSPGKGNPYCDLDGDGYTKTSGDCDDASKAINPDAVELCNGLDDDCNGKTDDDVLVPPGVCLGLGICAEPKKDGAPVVTCKGTAGFTCSYKEGYEAANETTCDSVDNDCDGQTDEGMLNACGKCGPPPTEQCNGLDDDCDGATDEQLDLAKHDCGSGICALAKAQCAGVQGVVCKMPPAWEQAETRCDGLDNDCDGKTDEGLGLGNACAVGIGACQGVGVWVCGKGDARMCDAARGKASAEVCGDARDNDCDGTTDEGFGVGEQCAVGLGECRVVGKQVCDPNDPGKSVCQAKPAAPATSETCGNKLDDDCDGLTDEPGCRKPDGADDGGCNAAPARGSGRGSLPPISLILLGFSALALVTRRSRAGPSARRVCS